MGNKVVILPNVWDFSSDSVRCVNRNGPLRKTKRSGIYEMRVRLHQTFLLQSLVLHASNNMGNKCCSSDFASTSFGNVSLLQVSEVLRKEL